LPSLVKAYRIQDKVRGVGFDWDNTAQVLDKVNEELEELSVEVKAGSDRIADEFGDVFFALINYARFLDVNPDEALERTNKRFIERFKHLEASIKSDGKDIGDMPLVEMEEYWGRAKRAKG
jgi:XTP/dITP diphosphohydrolase